MSQHYSVIIIGAGLSGLHSAWQLQKQGESVLVLEARERIGGRIYSPKQCDLGPAWLWPNMQPRLDNITQTLNLNVISQYTKGDQFYQFNADKIERYNDVSGHAQSCRIDGGVAEITQALMSILEPNTVVLNASVNHILKTPQGVEVSINHGEKSFSAEQLILALPPRVCLQNIEFEPKLDASTVSVLNAIPTWMASQAKMVFIYQHAFWREQNMSGEAMSQHGPLREISDACNDEVTVCALSVFIGLNATQRDSIDKQQLIDASLKQLQGYFGDDALSPIDVQFKDWAREPLTCSELDLTTQPQHPQYPANLSRTLWDGKIILSGSELAAEHGGYLEGALESSLMSLNLTTKN